MKKARELVDCYISDSLPEMEITPLAIPSNELLTSNRLDLGFKLAYLDLKDNCPALAVDLYRNDIRSQTFGKFIEFGAENEKNNFEKYISTFERTYRSISVNGFDKNKSLVPVSEDGSILNGAHRVASGIHLGTEVYCLPTDLSPLECNHDYFFRRAVPQELLEIAVCKFIEYSENCHIAFLWPSGAKHVQEAEALFERVVFRKRFKLTRTGAMNLLHELYKHMDWLGNEKNGWSGLKKKLLECFPTNGEVTAVVFQAKSLQETRDIKAKIREVNQIGFSSIHITDTKSEAERISKLIFNAPGLHFINHARPTMGLDMSNYSRFKQALMDSGLDAEDFSIGGSSVLHVYGLRKSEDLDFLTTANYELSRPGMDNHLSQLKYYGVDVSHLVYDPRCYFTYEGLKFVSLEIVHNMKKARSEGKDQIDLALMRGLADSRKYRLKIATLNQFFFYQKIKVSRHSRDVALKALRRIGLYRLVRRIYRAAHGREK